LGGVWWAGGFSVQKYLISMFFGRRNQLGKYLPSHKTKTHLEDKHEQVKSGGQLEQAEQQGPKKTPAGVVAQEI